MTTWTFKGLLGGALMLLTACEGGIDVARRLPERISVAGDSVVIAGPPGYCIDKSATRDATASAFVLLGSCASIARDAAAPAPRVPGLLTVSVSNTQGSGLSISESLGRLESYFETPAGRATLSREGRAETIEILEMRQVDGALYIHATDTGAGSMANTSDEYWRALLDVNGRLVTASVVGFTARPMSPDTGLATLDALAERIRRENATPELRSPG